MTVTVPTPIYPTLTSLRHVQVIRTIPEHLLPILNPLVAWCHDRDIPPPPCAPLVASTRSPVHPELAPSQPDPHPDPLTPCPRLCVHSAASAMLM